MNVDLNVPVDELHDLSLRQVRIIRQAFEDARRRAARWEPTMWPPHDTDGAA